MFTEQTLLENLKDAHPGETLHFDGVSPVDMEAALAALSARAAFNQGRASAASHDDSLPEDLKTIMPRMALSNRSLANAFNLGDHVSVETNWWGLKIYLDSEAVNSLTAAGASVAAMLTAIGVTAWVAAIIAGIMGIIKVVDRGNGVDIYFTWTGVHWYLPH